MAILLRESHKINKTVLDLPKHDMVVQFLLKIWYTQTLFSSVSTPFFAKCSYGVNTHFCSPGAAFGHSGLGCQQAMDSIFFRHFFATSLIHLIFSICYNLIKHEFHNRAWIPHPIGLTLQGSMNFDSRSFLTEKLKLSPLAGGQVQTWPGILYPFFALPLLLLLTFMGGAPSPLIPPLNAHIAYRNIQT